MAATFKNSKQNEFSALLDKQSPEILLLLNHLHGWHSVLHKATRLLFRTAYSTTVKLTLDLHASRRYMEEWRYSSTHSLELAEDERSASCPGRFTPKERAPGTNWIGGWVGPLLTFRRRQKSLTLPRIEPYVLGHAACSLAIISSEFSRYLFPKECS
jgi:hypothetical protein